MLTLVNWFNPVIWYAFSVLRRDIKLIVTDEEKNVEDEYFPFSPGRIFVEGDGFGFYAPGSEIFYGYKE